MKKNRTVGLTTAALIAASYVILTYVANIFGLASGVIQIRLSEALTILPAFIPSAVPGLFAGCILANVLTGCAFWDIVFGSVATLIGAVGTLYFSRFSRYLASIPPVLSNMLIVPVVLQKVYGITDGYLYLMLTVAAGEIICCGILGQMLYSALEKRNFFNLLD